MYEAFSHCTYCGAAFPPGLGWPRACSHCHQISYRNPIPVTVVLLPVDEGILAVRRAIPPRLGQLALPGGFVNYGETWQEAGAREVLEETGLVIDPAEIREYHVRSAPDGTLILFGLSQQRRSLPDLPPFSPNEEASERVILHIPTPMAFQLHEEVIREYLESVNLAPGS